jgi:hypothetical protein
VQASQSHENLYRDSLKVLEYIRQIQSIDMSTHSQCFLSILFGPLQMMHPVADKQLFAALDWPLHHNRRLSFAHRYSSNVRCTGMIEQTGDQRDTLGYRFHLNLVGVSFQYLHVMGVGATNMIVLEQKVQEVVAHFRQLGFFSQQIED